MTKTILTKRCPKCKKKKNTSEFYRNGRNGLISWCKECEKRKNRKYYQDHKEIIKERDKQRYQDNKETIRIQHNQYYQCHKVQRQQYLQNHKEIIKVQKKQYQQDHKETLKVHRKQYLQDHKETIKVKMRQYQQDHKEIIKEQKKQYFQTESGRNAIIKSRQKRRALKYKAIIEDFTSAEIFLRDNYRCQLCGKKTRPDFRDCKHLLYPNLDHIVPLSLGGEHSKRNTQCLCHRCNMKKYNTGVGDQLLLFG